MNSMNLPFLNFGTSEQWSVKTMGSPHNMMSEQWGIRTMGCWNIGVSVQRDVGTIGKPAQYDVGTM